MHEVAGEDRLAVSRRETHGDVAGGVARRGLEAKPRSDLVVLVDERGPAGLDHRQHTVGDAARRLPPLLALPLPELPLLAVDHVAGAGERRHPAPALEPRVPADVVHVQVRAHDRVDLLGRDARRREVIEPRALPVVPERRLVALLAVADAGVDEDRAPRHPHHPRLDARAEIAGSLVEEVGLEPGVMAGDRLGRGLRQHVGRGIERAPDLHHPRDADLAEPERVHQALLTRATISADDGLRPSAFLENTTLPFTITSSTPSPPMRSRGRSPSAEPSSSARRPASRRMAIHMKQRLISTDIAPSLSAAASGPAARGSFCPASACPRRGCEPAPRPCR